MAFVGVFLQEGKCRRYMRWSGGGREWGSVGLGTTIVICIRNIQYAHDLKGDRLRVKEMVWDNSTFLRGYKLFAYV